MGRQKIKIRNAKQAAVYHGSRPWEYKPWVRWVLPVLAFFRLAKSLKSTDTAKDGTVTTVFGYTWRGAVYMTRMEQVTPDPKANPKVQALLNKLK